jgi:Copper type II ascorbate-dependent monooxygenase, C-terminal domain
MQLHWNNPSLSSAYVDSSGLTIHYTTNLRSYDGEVLIVGQTSLDIPPGVSSIDFQGYCPAYCTSALKQPVYVTDAFLHMHTLGKNHNKSMFTLFSLNYRHSLANRDPFFKRISMIFSRSAPSSGTI